VGTNGHGDGKSSSKKDRGSRSALQVPPEELAPPPLPPQGGAAEKAKSGSPEKPAGLTVEPGPPPPPPPYGSRGPGVEVSGGRAKRAKGRGLFWFTVFLGILVLLLVVASGLRWVLPALLSSPGSTADDERFSRSALIEEWQRWRDRVEALRSGSFGEVPAGKLGWWQELTTVPSRDAVQAALRRRLGPGVEIVEVQPVQARREGEGVRVLYRVTVRALEAQYLVPIGDAVADPRSSPQEQELLRYVLFARGLPPGKVYLVDQKALLLDAGKELSFGWTVRKAVKSEGIWKILEADPVPLERGSRWEAAGFGDSRACVVRSASEVQECLWEQEKNWQEFRNRVASIQAQLDKERQELRAQEEQGRAEMEKRVSEYRQKLLAEVPRTGSAPHPNRELLKSGTGTPTAAGLGALSGAAAGALLGGVAGGGEGAGIGAGIGALGGFLGGLVIGKSHEAQVYHRRRAAYLARQRAREEALHRVNQAVEDYRKQLESEYQSQRQQMEEALEKRSTALWEGLKEELKEKARRREEELNSLLEGEKGLAKKAEPAFGGVPWTLALLSAQRGLQKKNLPPILGTLCRA
jgi:uncharacterized membrane protein